MPAAPSTSHAFSVSQAPGTARRGSGGRFSYCGSETIMIFEPSIASPPLPPGGIAKALEPFMGPPPTSGHVAFKDLVCFVGGERAPAFANLSPKESLADGLEANLEEIR